MTTKYQLSLPFALLAASPSLAALHATRARILNPTESTFLDATHCLKCGSYLLNADGKVTIERPRKRRKGVAKGDKAITSVLKRTCGVCGFRDDVPVDRGNASLFPKIKKGATPSLPTESSQLFEFTTKALGNPNFDRPSSQPRSSSVASSTHPAPTLPLHPPQPLPPARSKNRSKKKSGLQDMLLRNKEREEKERLKENHGQGGLAAFLSGL